MKAKIGKIEVRLVRFAEVLIIALFAVMLFGCNKRNEPEVKTKPNQLTIPVPDPQSLTASGITLTMHKKEFEGHSYIMAYAYRRLAMTHDPDCKCRSEK